MFRYAFLFLLFLGCERERPIEKKTTLNLNISRDVVTFDPRKGGDFVSATLQFLLFEGLTRMTPYSVVANALADHIDVAENNTLSTFHLREAKWSDGKDITAFDFVQTWKDMLEPKFPCPNAHLLYPIKNAENAKRGLLSDKQIGVRAIDYRTLEVRLEKPTPYFLEMISFSVFFPICQSIAIRNAGWSIDPEQIVCNGPYRITRYKRGHEIVLEKNPYYWDAEHVQLEHIHISIIDNEMTAMRLFERDELDILGLPFTGIPSDYVPKLMNKGVLKTTSLPASTLCCFNMDAFPFTNANIRKAFAYAIDRKEIIENLAGMNNEVGLKLLPSSIMPEQPGPFFRDGDAELARIYLERGLAELNISREQLGTITLLHASTGDFGKIALALQEQWRKALHIPVQLMTHEYGVFLDKLTHRDFQMAECIWIAQYQDPMNFFERFKKKDNPKNYSNYENEQFSSLLDASNTDPLHRLQLLQEASTLFIKDMPLTPIFHWRNVFVQKPYIQDLLIYPSGGFHLANIHFEET